MNRIKYNLRHLQLLSIVKNTFFPFVITMFVVYSMMYLLPAIDEFRPELLWPLSFINWVFQFITFQFVNSDLYDYWITQLYFINTLKFVFGSLMLSAVVVGGLLLWRFTFNNRLFRFLLNILKLSSGLHILILGLFMHRIWPNIDNPLDLRLLFILALGNGSLIELYFTMESEIQKILKKEYVLAGVAWGFHPFRFPLRELALTYIEFLNARIPILFSSTIVVEYVFALDGLSSNIVYYIENRDYYNIVLVSALISVVVIFFDVITERIRYVIDPRVRNSNEIY